MACRPPGSSPTSNDAGTSSVLHADLLPRRHLPLALLAPFDRHLALRLGGAARPPTWSPHLPEVDAPLEPSGALPGRRRTRREVARFLVHALLADADSVAEVVAELEASVDEQVDVWSPCVHTTGRAELVAALVDSDDSVIGLEVAIIGEAESNTTVFVEWRLEGRFVNAGFLNDDVLMEPSGGRVVSSGVLVVVFGGSRVTHLRCYYDGVGVLEQVVLRDPATSD